jgi:thiamine-monophosphate kinase
MKEYELIQIIKDIVDPDLNFIGNDTAVIKETGLVLTCDTLVEDTHFRLQNTTPFELGYKAAAVNLSDIAASGGICKYLLVALAMPPSTDKDFIRELYNGMVYLSEQFNTKIVGGDLTRSDKIVITVTAIGQTENTVGRNHAQIGQKIISTGSYGISYTGLMLLEASSFVKENDLLAGYIDHHKKPYPRIHEAQYFIQNTEYDSYCMMDTSDGLADAVFQLAKSSEKRLHIYLDKIPIMSELFEIHQILNINTYQAALYGGEDFELIFTCHPQDYELLLHNKDFIYTEIGEVVEGDPGVSLITENTFIELDEYLLAEESTFTHF